MSELGNTTVFTLKEPLFVAREGSFQVIVDLQGAGSLCVVAAELGPRGSALDVRRGCSDSRAVNFDAAVTEDDGSCLYLGGRGVSTQAYSSMPQAYATDDWCVTCPAKRGR